MIYDGLVSREKRVRSKGKLEFLERMGKALTPYFENIVGENASWIMNLEPGEMVSVNIQPIVAEIGLPINWVGVGLVRREDRLASVLGIDRGEVGPNAISPVAEFFPDSEPFGYRVIFGLTKTRLGYEAVERLVVSEESYWEECDIETSYLILRALEDVLPRLMQRGE